MAKGKNKANGGVPRLFQNSVRRSFGRSSLGAFAAPHGAAGGRSSVQPLYSGWKLPIARAII